MSRPSTSTKSIPFVAKKALAQLGENVKIARKRRKESLRSWAKRMDASVPTIQRMEKGDPTVGIGVYATAIFLSGDIERFGNIASPKEDSYALNLDILQASKRGEKG